MSDTLISVIVLGSSQFLVALFILWQAFLSRASVTAMRRAYLEGHLRLSVVPRGATGILNMRLENTGQGAVNEVRLRFPSGLRVIDDKGVQTLVENANTTWKLGSMGPGEKREWHIGNAGHEAFAKLGDNIAYVLCYRRIGARKETRVEGSLSLSSYKGTLVRAYADQGDLLRQIQNLAASLKDLANQHKVLSEIVKNLTVKP